MKRFTFLIIAAMLIGLCCACSQRGSELQDGYYTAEAADFDEHGWKEYVTIYISGNRVVTVEYDARNSSGFIKSWDMDYMREMNSISCTYPNEYARYYSETLVNRQDPGQVDAISGASHSHISFQLIAQAAIDQAKAGNKSIAYVELNDIGE